MKWRKNKIIKINNNNYNNKAFKLKKIKEVL